MGSGGDDGLEEIGDEDGVLGPIVLTQGELQIDEHPLENVVEGTGSLNGLAGFRGKLGGFGVQLLQGDEAAAVVAIDQHG